MSPRPALRLAWRRTPYPRIREASHGGDPRPAPMPRGAARLEPHATSEGFGIEENAELSSEESVSLNGRDS